MKSIITVASFAASVAPYLLATSGVINLGAGALFTCAALLLSAVAFEIVERVQA